MIIEKYLRSRRVVGSVVLLVLGLIGLSGWQLSSSVDDADHNRWFAVQPQPLELHIALSGYIEPHRTVVVAAPFDGNVIARLVEDGQQVEAGQMLLSLDPVLVQVQVREALSTQLKARRTVQDLNSWHDGPEVARARRALRVAQTTTHNLAHKLDESSQLFERGIIARNEVEDLKQQLHMQRLELAAAQIELQQVLKQGTGENLQIAEMELANATVKYDELRRQVEGGNLIAPFRGVVLPLPPTGGESVGTAAPLQAGSKVNQGQPLLGLADIEQLKVVAKVSELDVNQLRPGQTVEILGDGFEGERLSGSVVSVNGLAINDDSSGASARFAVTLSIPPLTAQQLQRVRLGMSVRLSIVTYRNEQAMVIPPAAIVRENGVTQVGYRKDAKQAMEYVTVTLGQATLQGVEVFGLASGHVWLAQ